MGIDVGLTIGSSSPDMKRTGRLRSRGKSRGDATRPMRKKCGTVKKLGARAFLIIYLSIGIAKDFYSESFVVFQKVFRLGKILSLAWWKQEKKEKGEKTFA